MTEPTEGPAALFPVPAPPGLQSADLKMPDPAWRAAVRDRRGPNR